MPTVIPLTGYRYYSRIPNSAAQSPLVSFGYVADTGVVWQQQDNTLVTGAMRPVLSTDLASTTNLSVSGLNLSVGAVNLTGDNPVRIVNISAIAVSGIIQGGNLLPVFVTGLINTVVTGTVSSTISSVAVTGGVSGSAQGNLDLTRTYLPVSGINFSASVSVSSVAITGFNSGSALANLDLSRTYLPISGVNTLNVNNVGGYVGVTGAISGNGLGNLDLTRTYLPISGAAGVFVVALTGLQSVIAVQTGTLTASIAAGTSVAVTGGTINVLDNSGWAFLAAISGSLASNLSTPAAVTGYVSGTNLGSLDMSRTYLAVSGVNTISTNANITNTAPINVTGIINTVVTGSVSTTVTSVAVTGGQLQGGYIGITGTVNTTASVTVNSVAVTGGFLGITGTVNISPITVNATGLQVAALMSTGGYIGITGIVTDQVTGWNTGIIVSFAPVSKTVSSNSTPSGVAPFTGSAIATGQILALNATRTMFFIQNIHTGTPLYVNFGSQAASTGSFSFILNPSATQGFGGSSFSDDHYRGPITVSGGAWTAWEL